VQAVLQSLADSLQNSLLPLVRAMDKKIDIDLGTHNRMQQISGQLRELAEQLGAGQGSAG
jgi:hypothetical protein